MEFSFLVLDFIYLFSVIFTANSDHFPNYSLLVVTSLRFIPIYIIHYYYY
jgi:hypothetical protein